ncbi:metallophosphoesterase [Adhaeretor mobilis]|uniref:Putative metallophosphoesterase n=1 Tax=Adhaeretor mobilis TaxID=1930276 RepID=A0A517MPM9_9BACT|nr:metallophosphoesterase [Adhaeretor mobilis]QDS96822.1 putative metallophosphoesterase [Adhaeretor mobilis]
MAKSLNNSTDSTDSPGKTSTEPPTKCRPSRRKFLKRAAAGLVTAGIGTGLYAWRFEPHWVEVVHETLPIERLPAGLVGKRLVQLSDLHVGDIVDHDYITSAMKSVAALEPDLIVITGDLMTCHYDEQIEQATDVLGSLPKAKLGRFAIFGNHDYGDNWQQHLTTRRAKREIEKLGITVLRNELMETGGLQIVGIDDLWTRRFNPEQAFEQLDRERASLVLCHNPDGIDKPSMQDYRGWILAGHTHGGQCKPPWAKPPILPVQNHRYTAGKIVVDENRQLYINRGLGYTHRVRFNCRPEITVFTLEQAANDSRLVSWHRDSLWPKCSGRLSLAT